jgi:hypothetical protein
VSSTQQLAALMSSVLLLQSVCAVLGFGAFSAGNVG